MRSGQDDEIPVRRGRRAFRGPALGLIATSLLLFALAVPGLAPAAEGELRVQLLELVRTENVTVSGIDRIGEEPAQPAADGTLRERLKALLSGYNYTLVEKGGGRIEEIRILGRQVPVDTAASQVASALTIKTIRRGSHHVVEALLVGPSGAWRRLPLILDTGATNIVLPSSAIDQLGFRPEDIGHGWAETAGGRIAVQTGRLDSVSIGPARQSDVEVIFIDDGQLGERALLGMSFLGRYRLTIDDAESHIVLSPN